MTTAQIDIRLQRVERSPSPFGIKAFGVDLPTLGTAYAAALPVAGWVAPEPPYVVMSIEIIQGDTLLKCTPMNISRLDVAHHLDRVEHDTYKFGFDTQIGTLGLPRIVALRLRAGLLNLEDSSIHTVELATLHGVTQNRLAIETQYQPIILTAIGRSGTTLLMQIFNQHPDILTSDFYPYEVKQASYWMQVLKVLSAPADFSSSSHPDAFERNLNFIGHNPYSHPENVRQFKNPAAYEDLYNRVYPAEIIRFCTSRIDEFYALVSHDERKQHARRFAEKFLPGHIPALLHDIYQQPGEIILTRDFRDVICSASSFNRKRNSQGFGRDKAGNDLDWISNVLAPSARALARAWKERQDTALHVRYEDVVRSPEAEITRIFKHLQVDYSPALIESIVNAMSEGRVGAVHKTSVNSQQSIARWKTDMPEELLACCEEHLSAELELFGYQI